MQYFNEPIIESPAKVILVPVMVGGYIPAGSIHDEIAQNSPEEYRHKYLTSVKGEMVTAGRLRSICNTSGRWKGAWFVHAAVGADINFGTVTRIVHEALNLTLACNAKEIAIPWIWPGVRWDTQDLIMQTKERLLLRSVGGEIWAYTDSPTDDDFPKQIAEPEPEESKVLTIGTPQPQRVGVGVFANEDVDGDVQVEDEDSSPWNQFGEVVRT